MPSSEDKRDKDRSNLAKGRAFEKLAARFYSDQGYEILDRNWQAGHKELDLVVKRANTVVFVEVKSSYSKEYGHPVERVDQKKIKNLSEAARQYLIARGIENTDLRFDVVTFVDGQLEYFPDAFPAE